MTRLEEIAQRLAKATPGPWKWERYYLWGSDEMLLWAAMDGDAVHCSSPENAALIAHAPADISYLLEAVASARREALEEAAKVAEQACLVPPDGGSPSEDERMVAQEAALRIRALIERKG